MMTPLPFLQPQIASAGIAKNESIPTLNVGTCEVAYVVQSVDFTFCFNLRDANSAYPKSTNTKG
jgi:hypothetical protein